MLILCGHANAFTWFWSKKEPAKEDRAQQPVLQIQAIESQGENNSVARVASARNVFVICSDCPAVTPPVRDIQDVSITIRMSQRIPEAESMETSPTGTVPAEISSHLDVSPDISPMTPVPIQSGLADLPNGRISSCFDPPVHFEFNSAEVSPEEVNRLKERSHDLKSSGAIEVLGYTCEIGSKEYNDDLAMKRAKAVARILEGMGLTDIRVKAEGKCCYVSDDNAKNRRVEITCIKEPKKGG